MEGKCSTRFSALGGSLFYLDDPEIGLRDDPPKVKCENRQNGLACVPPKNDPPFKISTRVRVLSLRKQNNGYPKETSNIVKKKYQALRC